MFEYLNLPMSCLLHSKHHVTPCESDGVVLFLVQYPLLVLGFYVLMPDNVLAKYSSQDSPKPQFQARVNR